MSTVEQDTTYNGWKNYPTWAVNLWLSNDHALYLETQERVATTVAEAKHDANITSGIWTVEQATTFRTADMLKEYVEELCHREYDKASMLSDLIGYALGEVDWEEVANAWLSDE